MMVALHERIGGLEVVVNDAEAVQHSQHSWTGEKKMSVERAWRWEEERAQREKHYTTAKLGGGKGRKEHKEQKEQNGKRERRTERRAREGCER